MARIVTYNVHRCIGVDGGLSIERIVDVIAACDADIVVLQELDVGRIRTGGVDQAYAIAQLLGMTRHFHPALRVMEELYGDAILTSLPSRLVKADALPGLARRPLIEPRGALWAEIEVDGQPVQVVNTHFGLAGRERVAQADALLGPDWLGGHDDGSPLILAGDFNAPPLSAAYRRLRRHLTDAQVALKGHRRRATFPSRFPFLSLDHVFFKGDLKITAARTVATPLARVASDHLPLLVDFQVGTGVPVHSRSAAMDTCNIGLAEVDAAGADAALRR